MKFGKRLRQDAAPGWADKYLAYKRLKQIIKTLPQAEVRWIDCPLLLFTYVQRWWSLTALVHAQENVEGVARDFLGTLQASMSAVRQRRATSARALLPPRSDGAVSYRVVCG